MRETFTDRQIIEFVVLIGSRMTLCQVANVGGVSLEDNPQFHYNLGLAYQRSNEFEEALTEFQNAIDEIEDKVQCCIRVAECSLALNRPDEALDVVSKGLKLDALTDEEKLELNYHLGLSYKAKGDVKKALKVFTQIQEVDKNYETVDKEIKDLTKL